ncbi:hypothetical protein CRG98_009172, partial [Punica granatum]
KNFVLLGVPCVRADRTTWECPPSQDTCEKESPLPIYDPDVESRLGEERILVSRGQSTVLVSQLAGLEWSIHYVDRARDSCGPACPRDS